MEGEERWVETLQTSYLVHGEVGEQDDKVLLHSDDEAGVALVSPGDHLHVVAHPEIFSHLVSRELQRVLHGAHTGQRAGQREYVQLHQIMLRYSKSRPLYSCAMRRRGSERITNQKVKVMTPVSCVQDYCNCARVCACAYLQVLVLGHDGDLVAVHAEDLSLQVDQLALTHLHVVAGLQVVLTLLT